MVDAKALLRWESMALGVIGLIQLIVATWAIEASISGRTRRYYVGDGPKLAVAAGVFLLLVAIISFFVDFKNRMHLFVTSAFLALAFIISIAAMGVAINYNEHSMKRILFSNVSKRLKAVAGISGFSAFVNFLVLLNAAMVARG